MRMKSSLLGGTFHLYDEKEYEMRIEYKGGVYVTEKAHGKGEGLSEFCYGADGKECSFLNADLTCGKPKDVPPCCGDGQSVIWRRSASKAFRFFPVIHPRADHICFGCGCQMPGIGSRYAHNETLAREGCAHYIVTGRDAGGRLREWRLCMVCVMALHDMGYPDCKEGMFRPAARRANPKSREARAWNGALKEASCEGVMQALDRRGLVDDGAKAGIETDKTGRIEDGQEIRDYE